MNFPNGTNYNILGTSHGAALRMCISPMYPIITIPFDLWQNFQSYAGGTYIGRSIGENIWGEVFAASGVYAGDLTFTLSTGLNIKIPNNQLVVPDYSVDSAGHQTSNATTREILINSLQEINLNDVPLLGRTFLTSAYLFVNYDQSEFTLWQANPTTEQKLVAVGSGPSCPTTPVTANATTSAGPSASTSAVSSGSPSSTPSTPTGAIVGGALGAAVILGLLIGAALFLRRRSRNSGVNQDKRSNPSWRLREICGMRWMGTTLNKYDKTTEETEDGLIAF
ncbi:hypothetical protein MMC30_003297 [Trapelia coarctata]|nr:hypothetical protein [Trapelia coarctata]